WLPPLKKPRLRTEMGHPTYPDGYMIEHLGPPGTNLSLLTPRVSHKEKEELLLREANFDNRLVIAPLKRCGHLIMFFFVGLVLYCCEGWGQDQAERQEWLTVWAGMLPIILSAPQGGRQSIPGVPVRRGAGVIQFATGRDNNTDELAETIAIG